MKKLIMLAVFAVVSGNAAAYNVYFYNGSKNDAVQFYCSRIGLGSYDDVWVSGVIPPGHDSVSVDTPHFYDSNFLECYVVNPNEQNASLTDENNPAKIFFDNQGNASVAYYDGGKIYTYLGAKTWFK